LISFSTPNELYNIKEGANSFQIQVFSTTNVQPVLYNFSIEPSLYTMQRLVDACNEAITAQTIVGVTVSFSLLASYKVEFTSTSTSTTQKYVALYHVNKTEFFKSILHRLGYSRKQVGRGQDNILRLNNGVLEFVYGGKTYSYVDFTTFKILHSNNNEKLEGNFICYESPTSYLQLRSDLVHDFNSTFVNDDKTICLTKKDNVMQHIQVDVNVYSYIHFNS
jgi:hypothetical protein